MSSAIIPALLALLSAVHLMPEHIAVATGSSQKAVEYVAFGFEAAALWAALAWLLRHPLAWPVCGWGMAEGLMRSLLRLMLPMDRPPPELPAGQTLADVTVGGEWVFVALWAVLVLAQYVYLRGLDSGRP